jgi:exosortase
MLNLMGNLANEYFAMRFSILVVIGGIILFLLGKEFCNILLFPLLFLIFMIPIPSILMDQVSFPMQLFASKVAAKALYIIGIPALREGNIIQLANTSLEVVEACSGIRSLVSLLTLSVLFAYFSQKTFSKRVLLVVSALPVAIVANAARVTGTGMLAYYYGEAAAEGFFHGFSSWVIFVVGLLCLYVIGAVLSKIEM